MAQLSRIYDTQRWRRLRRLKLATDPLCQYCPPGRRTPATEVDHREAIKAGGDPWEWSNLASTCGPCHSRKTSNIEVHRKDHVHVPGCAPDGTPLCPCHPWRTP